MTKYPLKNWMYATLIALCMMLFNIFTQATDTTESPLDQQIKEAQAAYAEKSYATAAKLFAAIQTDALNPDQVFWINLHQLDSQLRNMMAQRRSDRKLVETTREELKKLVDDRNKAGQKDELWAEGMECLGDTYWQSNIRDQGCAWECYSQSMDYWAGSTNLVHARDKYLDIAWKYLNGRGFNGNVWRVIQYDDGVIPNNILQNAIKIARNKGESARMHILLALSYMRQTSSPDIHFLAEQEFQTVLKESNKDTPCYDVALFCYADWLESCGKVVWVSEGKYHYKPDFTRALEMYRKLLSTYTKENSAYYSQAQDRIDRITKPQVDAMVGSFFLPGSEVQFSLNYRNIKEVRYALYPIDLNKDIQKANKEINKDNFIKHIKIEGQASFFEEKLVGGEAYYPYSTNITINADIPTGAYLLEASGEGKTSRQLVLITDMAIITKTSPQDNSIAYICNALTGEPIPNANIHLLTSVQKAFKDPWYIIEASANTDTNGLATLTLPENKYNCSGILTAVADKRQAICPFWTYNYNFHETMNWKIYMFTDRPAYRPQEKVEWKAIVRYEKNSQLSTPPSGTKLFYSIEDLKGNKVKEDTVTLNDFGSVIGSLELTKEMPLGEYNILFRKDSSNEILEAATLFRLEEYKLPEYKVSIQPTPKANAAGYRIGDTIEATIRAEFYFGGPVANADVNVEVRKKKYNHRWVQPRTYPWLYERLNQNWWGFNPGEVVQTETLKTDASGEAVLRFETPRDANSDLEYTIDAHVTDASRRKITAQGSIKVTRQSYFVKLNPSRNIFHPGDNVTVDIQAQDANTVPQNVTGRIEVKRKYWVEKWRNPQGKIIEGAELEAWKDRVGRTNFPPAQEVGQKPWRLKMNGYEYEDVLSEKVSTGEKGKTSFHFKTAKDGWYKITWSSDDFIVLENGEKIPWSPIHAETTLWSATKETSTLQTRNSGINMVLDKDTARLGRIMPVMLQTDIPGRTVLFTVEANSIIETRVVHLTGNTKLIELPVTDAYTPNVWFSGITVHDAQLFSTETQLIVPPEKNFITVEITPDAKAHQPREKGKVKVRTLDWEGKPIRAEIALGIADESVYAIQSEYTKDPRNYFYGEKRGHSVSIYNSFWKPLKMITTPKKEDEIEATFKSDEEPMFDKGIEGNFSGVARAKASAAPRRGLAMDAGRKVVGTRNLMASAPATESLEEMDSSIGRAEMISENEILVRNDFRSTILWKPILQTDADGNAEIEVTYPDNLTEWRITSRAHTQGNQFGMQTNAVKIRQPLMVRLQAPRFFTVGDEVTVSAVLNNNSENKLTVLASIEIENENILSQTSTKEVRVEIPANGEKRVDWQTTAKAAGDVKIKVIAKSQLYADAMEKSYPVYEHGIEKFISRSGKLSTGEAIIKVNLPKERKPSSTSMEIQVTPSLAATMLDALPYLFDYPYGCTEQTMSRFLPAVIVARTLNKLGLKPEEIETRLFGGRDVTDKPDAGTRKPLAQLDEITQKSLDRLYDFQHSDNGWGWWKEGKSDAFMTAYVVWGLSLAKSSSIDIKENVLKNGTKWLDEHLVQYQNKQDVQTWMLHALTSSGEKLQATNRVAAFNNLYENRERLNPYTRAILTISAMDMGFTEKAQVLARNMENGVIRDEKPDETILLNVKSATEQTRANDLTTAHWNHGGIQWRWSENGVEATAFSLAALVKADPKSELIQPIVNWLVKNRRGTQWNNTRDTAICLLALCDFIKAYGEAVEEVEFFIEVNDSPADARKLSLSDLVTGKCIIWIDGSRLHEGDNTVKINKTRGKAPLYFTVNTKYFSLEEPITAVGNEIFVRRQYYKLGKVPTLLKGPATTKTLLKSGDTVESGDRIEAVLTIEGKNNYEYLLFEDIKPAGFESTQIKSGEPLYARELTQKGIQKRAAANVESEMKSEQEENPAPLWRRWGWTPIDEDYTGNNCWVYQEQRDRQAASFIDDLPTGVWELRYEFRAETPGQFHALPVLGQAMYVPELRCNSDEIRINVIDKTEN